MMFVLSYNQPTIRGGKVVAGTTYYVSHRPGDGGVDWGYVTDASKAVPMSAFWRDRFRKLHGSKATATEVTT